MPDVMIARTGGVVRVGGIRRRVYRGRTTAHVDAQVVADHPDLWTPLEVDYPAGGTATAPGSPAPVADTKPDEVPVTDESSEPDGDAPAGTQEPDHRGITTADVRSLNSPTVDPGPDPARPSAKLVRAWARDESLDVPARGRVPDELVDAYLEAHEG